MDRNEIENGVNKLESLGGDDRVIADLLSALPRVEAPANFEFGVNAKIAAGQPQVSSGIPSWIKVLAPLSLLVLVAATVVFYGILPGGPSELIADAAPPVAEQAAPAPVSATEILNPSPVEETPQPNRDAGTQASEKLVSPAPLPQKRQSGVANSDISRPGGSDDSAVSVPPVLSPRGIEPDQANAEIVVNDLLQMLGVNAELVGGDWIVRSTTSNSLAARAGVQADDVIEAVDDHILSAKTRIKGLLGARSCSVRRAGKVLRLDLRK